jgi:hypothetical protein
VTVPLPVPLAPDVTVIHEALLTAVHPQPLPAVTVTLPDPPPDPKLCEVGDAAYVQEDVKPNVLDSALAALPPGPTAATSATYTVPGTGHPAKMDLKSTVIVPVESGVGFPSELL